MPSVDELLNVAEVIATGLTETNDKIEIDADTRTMIIPETERIFGVMSDEKVKENISDVKGLLEME